MGARVYLDGEAPSEKEKLLLCKGADSNMIPWLGRPHVEGEQWLYWGVQEHLETGALLKAGAHSACECHAKHRGGGDQGLGWAGHQSNAEKSSKEKNCCWNNKRMKNRIQPLGATGCRGACSRPYAGSGWLHSGQGPQGVQAGDGLH